ncbi:hypothetical protein [Myceligenerans xiligouense]|uniref:hypothetical protein n=1 Tax=Myceligenerans xiligouense TaxID=253184 RepID=UPI000F501C78|nr:hypothetical protein [Myceligenerans xiligouense]
MEHLVDLDVLAYRLQPAIEEWKRWATVGPLTWRDEHASWPQPITLDRSSVRVPESLGLTLRRGDDVFEAVVWTGGWADVGFLLDDEVYTFCPEFRGVDGAYEAVVKDVYDFLA